MKRSLSTLLLGMAMYLGSAQVHADILRFEAVLDGPSWQPDVTVTTPGTGSAVVLIDTLDHLMTVHIDFADLLGGTTASHIHCCTLDPLQGLAGVATTTPTFAGFPLGVTSGTYDIILDLSLAGSYNPAFITASGGIAAAEARLIAAMQDEKTYVVVHSVFRPAGEIRGFLHEVPEPGTLTLLSLGLAGLALTPPTQAVACRRGDYLRPDQAGRPPVRQRRKRISSVVAVRPENQPLSASTE